MSEFEILTIRKLANKDGQERVKKFDPETGQPKLVNPATPGEDHEPWPLLGVTIEGDPPHLTSVGTSWVDTGVREGWLKRSGLQAVVRPAGPHDDPLGKTHTFIHMERLVINDHERGPVVYRVTQQADKYWVADGSPVAEYGTEPQEAEVRHFYLLKLVPSAMDQEGRRG